MTARANVNLSSRTRWPGSAIWGPLVLLTLSPLIMVGVAGYFLTGLVWHGMVWCWWLPRGRRVLLVYSDSPYWRDDFEQRILPRLGRRAVVLNWSRRRQWRPTLAVGLFNYFAGHRDFNPMAVVFRPWRVAQCIRLRPAFFAHRRGRSALLVEQERQLFAAAGVPGHAVMK